MSNGPVALNTLYDVLNEMLFGDTKLMSWAGRRFQRVTGPAGWPCYFWEHKPGYMKLIEAEDWPHIHALDDPIPAGADPVWQPMTVQDMKDAALSMTSEEFLEWAHNHPQIIAQVPFQLLLFAGDGIGL